MELANENVLNLISEYEAHPELWDPNSSHFIVFKKKCEAWATIRQDLCIPVEEVKKKMSSLLTYYKRERMKLVPNPACPYDPTESKWFAYRAFRFLEDIPKTKEPMSSENAEDVSEEDVNCHPNLDEESTSGHLLGGSLRSHPSALISTFKRERKTELPSALLSESMKEKKRLGLMTGVAKTEYAALGAYVAVTLQRMDQHQRNKAEVLVNQVLMCGLQQKLDDTVCICYFPQTNSPSTSEVLKECHQTSSEKAMETSESSQVVIPEDSLDEFLKLHLV